MHTFILYTSIARHQKRIGVGEFDTPEQAFKQLAGAHYKLEIEDYQFQIDEVDENTFIITTKSLDYLLKRK